MSPAPALDREHVIDRRVANALFPEARARLGVLAPIAGPGLAINRKMFGGLWVGGEAVLTEHALAFGPNAVNRGMHRDPETLDVVIPLEAIESVEDRKAMITQIIDVRLKPGAAARNAPGEVFSMRCFKAGDFSAAIREQAGLPEAGAS